MASTSHPPRPSDTRTTSVSLLQEIRRHAESAPDMPALLYFAHEHQQVQKVTRSELWTRALSVASALSRMGLARGGRCLLLSESRVEWVVLELACALGGFISVPCFAALETEGLKQVLAASEATVAVAENPWQAKKIIDVAEALGVRHQLQLVLIEERLKLHSGAEATLAELSSSRVNQETPRYRLFSKLERERTLPELIAHAAERSASETLSLCFTPGTEGKAKGVRWDHAALTAQLEAFGGALSRQAKDQGEGVLFLGVPFAQALGHMTLWVCLGQGRPLAWTCAQTPSGQDLLRFLPRLVVAVPRFFESIQSEVLAQTRQRMGGRFLAQWALSEAPAEGSLWDKAGHLLAERLLRPALAKRFGRNCQALISGGAALREDVAVFYLRFGVALRECYGLVEALAVTHVDEGPIPKAGTVGKALPGVEVRIADDGEVLVRGPMLSQGYWQDEAHEVRDRDGWFATGDLGRLDEGYLRVTGRKRDVIVLSTGRTLTPRPIERQLEADPHIDITLLHGEERAFVSALIGMSEASAREISGLSESTHKEAETPPWNHPKVYAYVEKCVARVNERLPLHAQVRKFAVLDRAMLGGSDVRTPIGTPRRARSVSAHRALLDSFYAEPF